MLVEIWRYEDAYQHISNVGIEYDWLKFGLESHQQWNIVGGHSELIVNQYVEGNFSGAAISVKIRRKWQYFGLVAIVPCVLIGAVEMATFLLKYNDGTRLELSFTCLVAYSMFQMTITNELPKSSENTPMLQSFITLFMCYISLTIILQAICIFIDGKAENKTKSPPKIFYRVFFVKIFKIFNTSKVEGTSKDWIRLAKYFDRFSITIIAILHTVTYVVLLSFLVMYSLR